MPLWLAHTERRPSRPDLWLLCDMSNSVRQFSCFMLLFVAILQRRFNRVRSFAFVDRLQEITEFLGEEDMSRVRLRGHDLTGYSHYGEVLRQFHVEHLDTLTRKTTVIILGDARNNWNAVDGHEVLEEVREAAAALYWLNPPAPGGMGGSRRHHGRLRSLVHPGSFLAGMWPSSKGL